MKIAVAQLGARRHYAVPRILHEAGMLERLFTDSYVGNKPWLEAALRRIPGQARPRAMDRWLGRTARVLSPGTVTSFDLLGFDYRRRLSKALRSSDVQAVNVWAGREFGRRVIQAGFGRADAIWGFAGSMELFEAAKRAGLRCILEQSIAPLQVRRHLLRAEVQRWPGWQPSLDVAAEVTEDERRQATEWALADLIVCGSQFVVDGIAECGGPVEKCRVVPYGVDLAAFPFRPLRLRESTDRLRVLFAGEVGLRKGAPWLLEAARTLGPKKVEVKLAGRVALASDRMDAYRYVASFLGAVPRSSIRELFAWADLFALPSLCEGSAVVTYEAVSSGVPVVCTPNTGALETPAVCTVSSGAIEPLSQAIGRSARDGTSRAITPDIRWQYGLDAYAARLLAVVRELDSGQPAIAAT